MIPQRNAILDAAAAFERHVSDYGHCGGTASGCEYAERLLEAIDSALERGAELDRFLVRVADECEQDGLRLTARQLIGASAGTALE